MGDACSRSVFKGRIVVKRCGITHEILLILGRTNLYAPFGRQHFEPFIQQLAIGRGVIQVVGRVIPFAPSTDKACLNTSNYTHLLVQCRFYLVEMTLDDVHGGIGSILLSGVGETQNGLHSRFTHLV